jgi:hypothetical protein
MGIQRCPSDNIAGQQNDRDACFALTALCLVSSPCVLPQSDTEGILVSETRRERGTREGHVSRWALLRSRDWDSTQPEKAIAMFQKAADLGDTMAEQCHLVDVAFGGKRAHVPFSLQFTEKLCYDSQQRYSKS